MSTDHPNTDHPNTDRTVRPTTTREAARERDHQLVTIDPGDYAISVVAFVPDSASVADAQYIGAEVRKALEAAAADPDGGEQ